ncbi:MAG: cytochrome c [Mariprofundus sp.]|nr:cytochrome c [Mariprofundus sp.]
MLKKNYIPIALSILMLLVVSYVLTEAKKPQRWYSEAQVQTGQMLFENHCASCHGLQAQGLVANWKQRDDNGLLPPPPLNGSPHAWHHAMPLLLEIVQQGGSLYDGNMPGFVDVLNTQEQLATVAYFQSYWDDETYNLWQADEKSAIQSLGAVSKIQNKQSKQEVQIDVDS